MIVVKELVANNVNNNIIGLLKSGTHHRLHDLICATPLCDYFVISTKGVLMPWYITTAADIL